MWKVFWSAKIDKKLQKIPDHVQTKFRIWATTIESVGMQETRKIKGFHDEPLKGDRLGQRSVRLNNAYRVIYVERKDKQIEIAEVIDVNKHEY